MLWRRFNSQRNALSQNAISKDSYLMVFWITNKQQQLVGALNVGDWLQAISCYHSSTYEWTLRCINSSITKENRKGLIIQVSKKGRL